MSQLEFLPMTKEHVERLLDIEALCFRPGWSRLTLNAILEDKNSFFIVGVLGEEIVGYGGIRTILDESNLDNIAVHPNFQGLGIGKRLLAMLIEKAILLKSTVLMLEVRESNQKALRLYKKFGFLPVGRREKYYTKPEEAAVLMNLGGL